MHFLFVVVHILILLFALPLIFLSVPLHAIIWFNRAQQRRHSELVAIAKGEKTNPAALRREVPRTEPSSTSAINPIGAGVVTGLFAVLIVLLAVYSDSERASGRSSHTVQAPIPITEFEVLQEQADRLSDLHAQCVKTVDAGVEAKRSISCQLFSDYFYKIEHAEKSAPTMAALASSIRD